MTMHDIETIAKLNREHVINGAKKAAAAGKHVVTVYYGLNAEHFRAFDTAAEAADYATEVSAKEPLARVSISQ
jgi:homoserine dehydrogenase